MMYVGLFVSWFSTLVGYLVCLLVGQTHRVELFLSMLIVNGIMKI